MDGFAILAKVAFPWQDWLTLGLFFLGMILIIYYTVKQKEETSADYFLAGRAAGWLAIGSSIWASNIGSEHLVGLAGAGAKTGLGMSHWEIQAWLILVLGWVFVPYYSRSRVFTMPEFLEKRYCLGARTFLSLISLVSYVLTKVAVTVWAGGIVFTQVLDMKTINLPFIGAVDFFWFVAFSLVIVTGIYTVIGGMKAVLYTSVLQVPVILLGSALVVGITLWKLGAGDGFVAGWEAVKDAAAANKTQYGDSMLNIVRSAKDPVLPWTGVLLGSAIIGFWYWCTDQYIVQRVLSAPNQKTARRGAIWGAYLKLTPVFIFMIPGLIAYTLYTKGQLPGMVDSETGMYNGDFAFPILVREVLPAGVKGLVVGGMVAALMSSLASLFNSSATLFTEDFYKHFRPQSSERHLVIVGRIATASVVIIGLLWIPLMKAFQSVLYEYLQDVQSLIAPGIAAVFVMGVFSRNPFGSYWKGILIVIGLICGLIWLYGGHNIWWLLGLGLVFVIGGLTTLSTGKAGLWGLIISFVLGMFRLFVKVIHFNFWDRGGEKVKEYISSGVMPEGWSGMKALSMKFMAVNWLHYCIFLFVLTFGTIFLISLFTKKPDPEKIRGLNYGSATPEQLEETRRSWGAWDVLHTVIILGIVVVFYIYFW